MFLLLTTVGLQMPFSLSAQESILSEVSYLYMEKLVAVAKENYPRIKGLNSQVAFAKSDLAGAKTSWLEPFSFQYVARSNQSTTATVVDLQTADLLTGYQFGITINPGSLLAKPSQIKKAREQLKLAQSTQEEYFLQLEAMVKTRYILYLQYQKALLPMNNSYTDAQTAYDAIKLKYQKGEATFLEYNSASTSLNSAIQAKLQSESNFLSAKISLEELTVKRLEEIK